MYLIATGWDPIPAEKRQFSPLARGSVIALSAFLTAIPEATSQNSCSEHSLKRQIVQGIAEPRMVISIGHSFHEVR